MEAAVAAAAPVVVEGLPLQLSSKGVVVIAAAAVFVDARGRKRTGGGGSHGRRRRRVTAAAVTAAPIDAEDERWSSLPLSSSRQER